MHVFRRRSRPDTDLSFCPWSEITVLGLEREAAMCDTYHGPPAPIGHGPPCPGLGIGTFPYALNDRPVTLSRCSVLARGFLATQGIQTEESTNV